MTVGAARPPDDPDFTVPNASRLYDWYLGGAYNFEEDRAFGRRLERIWPNIKPVARHNRAFLRNVVRDSLLAGVRQFLDLGSGVPTSGAVHEISDAARLPARVVHVDRDPVACAAGRIVIEGRDAGDHVAIIEHDLRDPDGVLGHPETRRLLDLSEPVCLLAVAVLHFVPDTDRPHDVLAGYRHRLTAGSRLALSHIAGDAAPAAERARMSAFCDAYKNTGTPLYRRDRDEVAGLFQGWRLLEPGVVFLPDWRPASPADAADPARPSAWCGVGELPA
jgi:hypothetical protein